MQEALQARLGRESKRLLGGEPVRLRSSEGSACFLLSDCTDADAGSLVRDPRHLQLVGGDSAPLVIDVDSLHPNGSAKGHLGAVSSAFFLRWVERWRRRLRAIMPLFVAPSRALEVCC